GLAADASGCFVVAASAASCDLGAVDVGSAIEVTAGAAVLRTPITAGGAPLLARPRALVVDQPATLEPATCPERPRGVGYVAYPECHLVAAVDLGSGEVLAGVSFADGGAIAIT